LNVGFMVFILNLRTIINIIFKESIATKDINSKKKYVFRLLF